MTHRSRAETFCIDCRTDDLVEVARFWEAALGRDVRIDEGGRYAEIGEAGRPPRLLLQPADHDPRIHRHTETDDQEAEARRLQAIGAREVTRFDRWIVMEAPTGYRFRLVHPQTKDFPAGAWSWSERGLE